MVFRDQPAHTLANAAPTVMAELTQLQADLAEALALLAESALDPEQLSGCTGPDCCWDSRANALLVRHGIRESETHPGSTLLAWGLHEVDPDDWLQP